MSLTERTWFSHSFVYYLTHRQGGQKKVRAVFYESWIFSHIFDTYLLNKLLLNFPFTGQRHFCLVFWINIDLFSSGKINCKWQWGFMTEFPLEVPISKLGLKTLMIMIQNSTTIQISLRKSEDNLHQQNYIIDHMWANGGHLKLIW